MGTQYSSTASERMPMTQRNVSCSTCHTLVLTAVFQREDCVGIAQSRADGSLQPEHTAQSRLVLIQHSLSCLPGVVGTSVSPNFYNCLDLNLESPIGNLYGPDPECRAYGDYIPPICWEELAGADMLCWQQCLAQLQQDLHSHRINSEGGAHAQPRQHHDSRLNWKQVQGSSRPPSTIYQKAMKQQHNRPCYSLERPY